MSIIQDVAQELVTSFERFRQYESPDYSDHTYRDHFEKLRALEAKLAKLSPEELTARTARHEAEEADGWAINAAIQASLEKLTPATFPGDDPEALRHMRELYFAVSQAYAPTAAQRPVSIVGVMLYLYSCLEHPHASWYATTWLAAFLQAGDWASAECVFKALTEETGVRGQFAKSPENRALLPMARSFIALTRDNDGRRALEYAEAARDNCAHDPRTHPFFEHVHGSLAFVEGRILISDEGKATRAEGLLSGAFAEEPLAIEADAETETPA